MGDLITSGGCGGQRQDAAQENSSLHYQCFEVASAVNSRVTSSSLAFQFISIIRALCCAASFWRISQQKPARFNSKFSTVVLWTCFLKTNYATYEHDSTQIWGRKFSH